MAFGMLGIPRRYSHFVFATIQSGLTCFIATGIASLPQVETGGWLRHWLFSWAASWALMLPVVLLAAPGIRLLSSVLTKEEQDAKPPKPLSES